VAADFTLPLYTGQDLLDGAESLTLADLRGKAVVLNFWAPLCAPCRAEMPDFQELWTDVKDQGQVWIVGVDLGPFTGLGDRESALRFLEEVQVTYPTGQAQSADIVLDYEVQGMPTTVFIRPDGTVMRKWTGALNRSKLEEITLQLLE
jgi:thiol-disulfide isomerase/thioredoxin